MTRAARGLGRAAAVALALTVGAVGAVAVLLPLLVVAGWVFDAVTGALE